MSTASSEQLMDIVAKLSTRVTNLQNAVNACLPLSITMDGEELVSGKSAIIPSASVTVDNVKSGSTIAVDTDGKVIPLTDDGGLVPVAEVNKLIVAFNSLVDRVANIEG